jgi:spermidine synthase
LFLLLTAVLSGAIIMIIEVLGSRVLGPFFGVSLFVWTSLISVTLLALALGYWCGGVLADSRGSAAELYLIIFLAGLWLLLIPYLKGPVLRFCMPLGLRAGAFCSSLILFGLPLLLLGCVTPYLVRLNAPGLQRIGRTVGGLYALSTLGSIAGTLLTGFFLIGYFGIDQIFTLSGSCLLLLAAGYTVLYWQGRRLTGVSIILFLPLLLPVLLSRQEVSVVSITHGNSQETVVASEESFYGDIKVVDHYADTEHTRELLIDGLSQGKVDIFSNLSVYDYSYFLTLIPYSLNPAGQRCLVLGLGPGIIPRWFAARDIATRVLEINLTVAFLAQDYFAFDESDAEIIIADPRYFLSTTEIAYDYIILDVFNGDTTPAYLLSVEALTLLRAHMNKAAILAINLIGSLRQHTLMTASVVQTLEQVFDQVDIYPTFNPELGEGIGNLVLIAYDGAGKTFDRSILERFPIPEQVSRQVYNTIGRPFRFADGTPAIVLSDDYNPFDFYDVWLKEQVRRAILATTDWTILTGAD